MTVPQKKLWKAAANGGDPRLAIDDRYATVWTSEPSEKPWVEIDLGAVATLGGLEIYWGRRAAAQYEFHTSRDGKTWERLCGSPHGEGGQELFGFPPIAARFVRLSADNPDRNPGPEVVQINLYGPDGAVSVLEAGRIASLGSAPVRLPVGESITADFGYVRSPSGLRVDWGEAYGADFSVSVSEDGENFRQMGRIDNGQGLYDNFYWPSIEGRFVRLTLHAASSPEGATVKQIKLRILSKDRMPIGLLERAACAGRGELYPQSLLGRQVYWTVLAEAEEPEEALFDEYGDLEPQQGGAQITPLLRLEGKLNGAPGAAQICCSLFGGSLPLPTVTWTAQGIEVQARGLAHAGQALVEYRVLNSSGAPRAGALVLAVRPVQINSYWQHGGDAPINAIGIEGRQVRVNDRIYAAFSRDPDAVTVAEFDGGDAVRLIEQGACGADRSLRSDSGLLSAAFEFAFDLQPGAAAAVTVACPMRDGVTPDAGAPFSALGKEVARSWRKKTGPRKIKVGDREVTETVHAQTGLILANMTRSAFRPGPRNYDRVWIRDGSSQALALLWAGQPEPAKAFVEWYAKRIYESGLVPPILDSDGKPYKGFGGDLEFDAQGQFVWIAAEVYKITRDRAYLKRILEPVVRAAKFIEKLSDETNAGHGDDERFHGLLCPSISHEGYSTPTYSYWDNFFALSAWRDCRYLASEAGDLETAAYAKSKGEEFAANLARSILVASELMGKGVVAASADRLDIDPTSTSIAFEPCRVEDVLPSSFLQETYDECARYIERIGAPDFKGSYTPYIVRNLNAFVALGRFEDAFRLLDLMLSHRRPQGWRHWAEVVWNPPRTPEYLGDMPHTWIGAEFVTAIRRMLIRENGGTLELLRAAPDSWWNADGIELRGLSTAFGAINLRARRANSAVTVDLALTGQPPEKVTVRYPGAKRAEADGKPCRIDGDVISSANFSRLVIEY
ncbi:MAG: discoidin domain-containing protein [Rhodomicrobium sp.]